jgi:hypothetical protein
MSTQKFNVEIVYTNEFHPTTEMSVVEHASFFNVNEAIHFVANASETIRTAGRQANVSIWKFTFNEAKNVYSAPSSQPPVLTLTV